MIKTKSQALPYWVRNLRALMEEQGLNPRSLSLKAGLNSTAVRDMLEGRSRFPRYDTAQALADVLGTTPALLMSSKATAGSIKDKGDEYSQNFELLTEIITRLQEVSEEAAIKLAPCDFAAMTATLYRRLQNEPTHAKRVNPIKPRIHDLLNYESFRKIQRKA